MGSHESRVNNGGEGGGGSGGVQGAGDSGNNRVIHLQSEALTHNDIRLSESLLTGMMGGGRGQSEEGGGSNSSGSGSGSGSGSNSSNSSGGGDTKQLLDEAYMQGFHDAQAEFQSQLPTVDAETDKFAATEALADEIRTKYYRAPQGIVQCSKERESCVKCYEGANGDGEASLKCSELVEGGSRSRK